MRKKQSIQELKKEARSRYERFIAAELLAKSDVGTETLARDFYAQEEPLLNRIARHTLTGVLVKWADDILSQSIGREAARNGRPQLVLPLGLSGIELPGAFSFINGANKLRFVANYKTQLFHLDSHAYVIRKHLNEVHESVKDFEKLLEAVRPVMDEHTTLAEALEKLVEKERPEK